MSLLHGLLAAIFPPMPEPIAELRTGALATVRGVVVPRDTMESPLTGERCVYYHYTVEEWHRSGVVGTGDGFWELAERDEAILEFYLQDGEARAIIAPQMARVERGRGVPVERVDLGGMLHRRAQQLLIRAGDELEVTGTVEQVDDLFDQDRAYRSSPVCYLLRAPADDVISLRLLPRP